VIAEAAAVDRRTTIVVLTDWQHSPASALLIALVITLTSASGAVAQEPTMTSAHQSFDAEPATTMFPHPADRAWWLSGQINLISQAHGSFTSSYEGPNSLRAAPEHALSRVWTIDTGYRVSKLVEVLFDVESAGGRGISDALGLAGFTNLDVVRNPDLGTRPYVARLMAHVTIPLGAGTTHVTPNALSLASEQPTHRLELRFGKCSLADFFDANAIASDSHLQFTNWTIDNTGAYDYAADTRGYTYAAIIEYDAPRWALRGAEALMPEVANGLDLDWYLPRARGENVELELRPTAGLTVRILGYANHANMGSYAAAIEAFEQGLDPRPDIEAHRQQGRVKEGLAGNVEYRAPHNVRLFARSGWNEGENESFAYTEVNNTLALGGDMGGGSWHRENDRLGGAFVSNGLSLPHQNYLRLGGAGFLLGDGTLQYGRETIVAAYYTAHVWRGVFTSAEGQYIARPGYNRDRGPVFVAGLRLHVEF